MFKSLLHRVSLNTRIYKTFWNVTMAYELNRKKLDILINAWITKTAQLHETKQGFLLEQFAV